MERMEEMGWKGTRRNGDVLNERDSHMSRHTNAYGLHATVKAM
jgi:hypothetical protein